MLTRDECPLLQPPQQAKRQRRRFPRNHRCRIRHRDSGEFRPVPPNFCVSAETFLSHHIGRNPAQLRQFRRARFRAGMIGNVVGGVDTTEITRLSLHKQGNTGNSNKMTACGAPFALLNPQIPAILRARFPTHGTGKARARIRVISGRQQGAVDRRSANPGQNRARGLQCSGSFSSSSRMMAWSISSA